MYLVPITPIQSKTMSYFIKVLVGLIAIGSSWLLLTEKGCQSSNDNGFRVEHSARMGFGLPDYDTTYYFNTNKITDKKVGGMIYRHIEQMNGAAIDITFADTTKPKKVTNRYVLVGSDTLFQILFTQIQSPSDVTPRQLNTLRQWLQTIRVDTSADH